MSKKLVRDSRFLSADSQLLYVIEQCLVGTKALSPPEYARLDRFVRNFNVNPPRNISETELKDVRKLLRKEVGK